MCTHFSPMFFLFLSRSVYVLLSYAVYIAIDSITHICFTKLNKFSKETKWKQRNIRELSNVWTRDFNQMLTYCCGFLENICVCVCVLYMASNAKRSNNRDRRPENRIFIHIVLPPLAYHNQPIQSTFWYVWIERKPNCYAGCVAAAFFSSTGNPNAYNKFSSSNTMGTFRLKLLLFE